MTRVFETTRRVEFRDTDAAGIVHFSVFFAYMEQAEHEFLRSLGLSVIHRFEGSLISWPRVHAECDYRKPARFEDVLTIQVSIGRIGEKSVAYQFAFSIEGDTIARGEIVAACCEVENHKFVSAVPVPEEFAHKIRPFLDAGPA